ncbi:MAG: inorganic diphosphatase [Patescibacteria group bacterium]|nr:inorganic diphosphatase [Patescibacteria group bacterium]
MKIFIENEAGSNQKNLYNEKTLEYKKTVTVSREYPYPYGFILNTTNSDGDNLDCFIITDKKLQSGKIYDCEPVGLMEQTETAWGPDRKGVEEQDHNILALLEGESAEINDLVKEKLTNFVLHVFDHVKGKTVRVGKFFGKEEALKEIKKSLD